MLLHGIRATHKMQLKVKTNRNSTHTMTENTNVHKIQRGKHSCTAHYNWEPGGR